MEKQEIINAALIARLRVLETEKEIVRQAIMFAQDCKWKIEFKTLPENRSKHDQAIVTIGNVLDLFGRQCGILTKQDCNKIDAINSGH